MGLVLLFCRDRRGLVAGLSRGALAERCCGHVLFRRRNNGLVSRDLGGALSLGYGQVGSAIFRQASTSRGRHHFMSTTRAVWIFILALTVIRLALLNASELSPDEAYYWMWSQRPAISYFSKGPGVALIIRASTTLFGDNEFGVRFFSPIFAAGTSLLLYYFAQ